MSKCMSTAQARTKCVSAFRLVLVSSLFPVHFRIKWLLWNVQVHVDCTGSHKVCVCVPAGPGLEPFSYKFSRIKWLLWNVQVHFDCAGLHKVCVCVLAGPGLEPFSYKFSRKVALVKCSSAFRLRRLAQSVCLRSGWSWSRAFFL